MKTEKKLIRYYNKLNNVPCLNQWGCLFAAYAIWLKAKQLWVDVILTQIDYWWDEWISTNKKFINWESDKVDSWNHFWLKINWILYDSNWEYSRYWDYVTLEFDSNVIEKYCNKALANDSLWSSWFDREYWTIRIKELIWIDLTYLITSC